MLRQTQAALVVYLALTLYAAARALLGLDFQHWLAFLLPLIGFIFALLHGAVRLGWRGILIFLGCTVGVSLGLESLGVASGLVYGPYHYTERLGPRFLGLVPYLIPITWFIMLYPSYIIAHRLAAKLRGWRGIAGVAALGGLVMTSWDLVVDPLMVARRHWVWEVQGAYFGIPLQNFAGWWFTSFVILTLAASLINNRETTAAADDFDRLAVMSYAITGFGNIFDAAYAGLGGPTLAALIAMSVWVWLGWKRAVRK